MACGCSANTGSSSVPSFSNPFLSTGGSAKKSGSKKKRKSGSGKKKRCKSNSRKGRKMKSRRKSQKGGVGLFGNVASNAVNFSNSVTGTSTVNSAAYSQPAGRSFSNLGNPYMV